MSYSHSFNSGQSTSNPQNMYSSQSTAAQNFAYTAAALGQQTYQWAQQTYAADTAMTQESVADYLQMSQVGLGLANENLTDYNNIYRPEMAQLANEAGSYSSAARQEVNEGAAEAQSEAGSNAGLSAAQQQLQSYGINPNSGMYQELQESQRAGAGAAAAGAGQEAGLATQATGRQLLQASLQQGDQLPAAAVNALNSAYEGVAGAENATLANANTGANMFQVPNSYFSTAMQLKYPPVGNQQQSTQGGGSMSMPNNNKPSSGHGIPQQVPQQNTGGYKTTPKSEPTNLGGQYSSGGSKFGNAGGSGGLGVARSVGGNQQDQQDQQSNYTQNGYSNQPSTAMPYTGTFYDPYSALGTGTGDFNTSQNIPGFDTSGMQYGSATVGAPTNSAIPYLGTPGSPGGGGPGAAPTVNSGVPAGGGIPTPAGSFGGSPMSMATPDTGGSGADSWANVSGAMDQFNPVSSAGADTFNQDPYQPFTQDQANGGNDGDIQPIEENAPPEQEEQTPEEETSGGDNSGDYSAPAPPPPQDEDNNPGGYGGYAAGGQVGMMRRGAIPMRPSPGNAMQMRMPMPSRGPGLARGGIPMPVSRNIPATRMGGFHSNAPSLRSLANGGPTTGGPVPRSASPSHGRQTDDIPSRLNADEFVIPRDATKYYGHKYFLDLIKKARAATGGDTSAPIKPAMKPMSQSQVAHPRFVSRPMGQ